MQFIVDLFGLKRVPFFIFSIKVVFLIFYKIDGKVCGVYFWSFIVRGRLNLDD